MLENSKRKLVIVHDLFMTLLAIYFAFFIRFTEDQFLNRLGYLTMAMPLFILSAGFIYNQFGLYRGRWMFASIPDLIQIFYSVMCMSIFILVIDYILVSQQFYGTFFVGKITIVLYALLQGAFLGLPRIGYRYLRYLKVMSVSSDDVRINTLIIGNENDAVSVIQAIEMQSLRGITASGIVTLKVNVSGQKLRGISVLGSVDQIELIVHELFQRDIKIGRLVATESALSSEAKPDQLMSAARRLGLPIWRIKHVIEDGSSLAELAPLDIEALLFRDSIQVDLSRLRLLIAGRRVAITGGGGSIGGELAQRIAAIGASHLLIIENSEPMMHQILEKLEHQAILCCVKGTLADIRDHDRICQVLFDFKPDLVLHAAALKHVPYLEVNWGEAIKTNIFGSKNVMEASIDAGAKAVVMISTDKAIDPVSILGVTKRFAEIYAQMLDQELNSQISKTCRVISVRFGNVLGSNGSVIPKFRAQIASGGPVTVTDPEMVRYFMTVREASELVLSAASHALEVVVNGYRPSVYVLKMGQQVRILDLARNLISLSGFEPDRDISIVFTGMRAGERLHEIMFDSSEEVMETGIEGVLGASPHSSTRQQTTLWLNELHEAVVKIDRSRAEKVFLEAIPNFHPATQPN
jgi:FlaA1/EpsC-like NDP-sugar epimerase